MKIEDLQTTVNKLSSQDVRSMFQTGRGKQKITIPATRTSWNTMFSIARQARGGAVGPAGIKKKQDVIFIVWVCCFVLEKNMTLNWTCDDKKTAVQTRYQQLVSIYNWLVVLFKQACGRDKKCELHRLKKKRNYDLSNVASLKNKN